MPRTQPSTARSEDAKPTTNWWQWNKPTTDRDAKDDVSTDWYISDKITTNLFLLANEDADLIRNDLWVSIVLETTDTVGHISERDDRKDLSTIRA